MADVFLMAFTNVTTSNTISLFTVPTVSTAILRSITLCNTSTSSTASCDVIVSPSPTTDFYLFRFTQITASQTMQPLHGAITVGPGSKLRFACSPANVLHVTASYLKSD